jgi:nitrous oxide reductase accessory protein NosL
MASRRRFLAFLGTATPMAAAAALGYQLLPGERQSNGLPAISWNEERCANCGMVISDHRYAAAWIRAGGAEEHFDDMGCMLAMLVDGAIADETEYFARAFDSDAWLDARTAAYVRSDALRSPMAYGIAAFADETGVRAGLVSDDVVVLDWRAIMEIVEGMA